MAQASAMPSGRPAGSAALQARGGAVARSADAAKSAKSGERSVADLEREIETTRARLASTVDQIATRVAPKNVAARLQASAKAQVVDPVSGPRYDRIAIAAGVVLAIVGLRVWRSRR